MHPPFADASWALIVVAGRPGRGLSAWLGCGIHVIRAVAVCAPFANFLNAVRLTLTYWKDDSFFVS